LAKDEENNESKDSPTENSRDYEERKFEVDREDKECQGSER